MIPSFEEFVNESEFLNSVGTDVFPVSQMWRTPGFSIKIVGTQAAKHEYEEKKENGKVIDRINKGEEIEVYDMEKKKSVRGKFMNGKLADNGRYYTEILLEIDGKVARIKSASVTDKE